MTDEEKKVLQMVYDGCISFSTAERYFPNIAEEKDLKFRSELIEFLDTIWHTGSNIDINRWSKSQVSTWIEWLHSLKSPKAAWHTSSDEPEKGQEIVICYLNNNEYCFSIGTYSGQLIYSNQMWAYVGDLLPYELTHL